MSSSSRIFPFPIFPLVSTKFYGSVDVMSFPELEYANERVEPLCNWVITEHNIDTYTGVLCGVFYRQLEPPKMRN